VALHRCGVTFVLDRAGVTGTDGASHNGMWDMSILQVVPGLRIAAPRDADQLRAELREALDVDDAPTVVRFPKAEVGPPIPAIERIGGVDVLMRTAEPGTAPDVLIVAVGTMAPACLDAAALLTADGLTATVVDPRWVKPVDPALTELAARHRLVVTVEDNGRVGGVGSAVAMALRDAEIDIPTRELGITQEFLAHASRSEILDQLGLTGPGVAAQTAGFAKAIGLGRHRQEAAVPTGGEAQRGI
jgi:1-deoxy-D-xylulose-5-phosphate synthase